MDLQVWQNSLEESMVRLWTKITIYIPNIASALFILLIGYFISKIMRTVSEKILTKIKLDVVCDKVGVHGAFQKVGIKQKFSTVIGFLIFWMFMLTFLISASESLGLQNVTETIDALIMYIPKVLGAAIVFVLGLMLTQFVAKTIENSFSRVGLDYSKILANITKSILLVVVTVLAIAQLKIETTLVDNILQIILISAGGVLALSLGLGTRILSKNLISGLYVKNQYKLNSSLTVNGKSGTLKIVGAVNSVIENKQGQRIYIPNSDLIETEVSEEIK